VRKVRRKKAGLVNGSRKSTDPEKCCAPHAVIAGFEVLRLLNLRCHTQGNVPTFYGLLQTRFAEDTALANGCTREGAKKGIQDYGVEQVREHS